MPRPISRVELYAAIRRDVRAGMSQRAILAKHGVGRRTVVAAESSAWPTPRKKGAARPSKLDPFKPVIDDWLRLDLDAPRKQRHTVKRIFDRLIDEHGMDDVSYAVVRAYVAQRRPQVRVEQGRAQVDAFVPQTHQPGAEAEVDFGDVTIRLAGELVVCQLFSFRLSYSGKAVHRVFATAGRKPSWRDTSTRWACWVGFRRGRSATTTSKPPSLRSWASPGPGWRPTGGRRSAPL